jgi:hypothetical protein
VLTRSEGTGALVSPLISTQFAQYPGRKWALYYTFLLGTLIINLTVLVWRFRGREYDGALVSDLTPWPPTNFTRAVILSEMGVPQDVEINLDRNANRGSSQRTASVEGIRAAPTQGSSFSRVMKQTVMHIMAIFIFVYVGVEVTIGGSSTCNVLG